MQKKKLHNRLSKSLDLHQPNSQTGFRPGFRIEEHISSTKMIIEKIHELGQQAFIIRLDPQKAFDTAKWTKLWNALRSQSVPYHLIWALQQLYTDQSWIRSGQAF